MTRSSIVGLSLCACALIVACNEKQPEQRVSSVELALLDSSACPPGTNIIVGTGASETLVGTPGADCILGRNGDDVIWGGGGDDFIAGGRGSDTIHGEDGDDLIYGELHDDYIEGGGGDDVVDGDDGDDVILLGDGDDIALGGDGQDEIHGGSGRDVVDGGGNVDTIHGDDDDDFLIAGAQGAVIDGGNGNDACNGNNCEAPEPTPTGCTSAADCGVTDRCAAPVGLCVPCLDTDGDGSCDSEDGCPADPAKTLPGICGCGVGDDDTDGDETPDCNDLCPGFDDGIDIDGDGLPDACDPDVHCTPSSSGAGVHAGDHVVVSPSDLDALAGIVCITGSLSVWNSMLSDFTGLESLMGVAGDISIDSNAQLVNLSGLDNLTEVGGYLDISYNPLLDDLSALGNLTALGTQGVSDPLFVSENPALPACYLWQLQDSTGVACGSLYASCSGNTGSGSCGSLPPDFQCVPGATGPGVFDGELVVSSYYGIPEVGGLTCVTGHLTVYDAPWSNLSALSTLQEVGGMLMINGNRFLASLDGLESLTEVGGQLDISYNPLLDDLSALGNLTALGRQGYSDALLVSENPSLPACYVWQLEALTGFSCGNLYTSCEGNSGSGSCGSLPPDFQCVPGATGPGVFDGELYLSAFTPLELGGVTCVTGNLGFYGTHLRNLSQLSELQFIGGNLDIIDNAELESLAGLGKLTEIGHLLIVSSNAALESLAGLGKLSTLGSQDPLITEPLILTNNANLPACWVSQLELQTGEVCSDPYLGPCPGNDGIGDCNYELIAGIPLTNSAARDAALGDFDGDGAMDLYLAGTTALGHWKGNGDGSFGLVGSNGSGGYACAVADLDRDGYDEVAVVADDGAMHAGTVYYGDSSGYLSGQASFIGQRGSAIGDLDGDDVADVVSLDSAVEVHYMLPPPARGVGEHASIGAFSTGPEDLALGDFDGDGDDEVLVAWANGLSYLDVHPDRSFSEQLVHAQALPASAHIAAADIDGDGLLDVVLYDGVTTGLLFGTQPGVPVFVPGSPLPVQGAAADIEIADLDRNGYPEVLVLASDGLSVLSLEGSPTVLMATPVADGSSVRVADVDGDADLDAVVTSETSDATVLLNDAW